jgi:3',5'-cyclic AMP phosphodiesterase CpdA
MTAPSHYRIIHLSDLHLTSNDSDSRSEARLFGRLQGMNERFRKLLLTPSLQQADLILITGDITDRGDIASWTVFRQAIHTAELANRVKALPGNHDICSLGLARLPAGAALALADREKARQGLLHCGLETRFPWAHQPHPSIVVIGVDSNNAGNLNGATNAVGNIGFYQLEALARVLRRYQAVPIKIIALHHSPNIPAKETAQKRFQKALSKWEVLAHQVPEAERKALRLLAITHGARLIIHGHLHYAEDRRVNGVRIIGAPSSTEPVTTALGKTQLQFFEYLISLNSLRLNVKLKNELVKEGQ